VAIGYESLVANLSSNNIGIGNSAFNNLTTGSNNIGIGLNVAASTLSANNEVTIYNGALAARFQGSTASWTFASDERDKNDIENLELGLNFINQLQPRKYKWNLRHTDIDKGKQAAGFIAQEVLAVAQANQAEYLGLVDTNDPNQYTLAQTALIPVLVNAVKELTNEVNELKAKLNQ
jgi:hypothetical protein